MRYPRNLTVRERYCILIASSFAVGKRVETLAIITRGIKDEQLPERMFSELFLHLSLLLGFPAMLEGFSILRTIEKPSNRDRDRSVNTGEASKKGNRILKRIYGSTLPQLFTNLKSLHALVPEVIVHNVYGQIISRPGLSLGEREIINVVVLSIQRLQQQLYSHIRGALRQRITPDTLHAAILLAAQITKTDTSDALKLLSSIVESRKSLR